MTVTLNTETWNFIEAHKDEDLRKLALQSKGISSIDMNAALIQIAGRQIAKEKIPSWHSLKGLLFPRHLSLEQCSSELTAKYKASLVRGKCLVDLTGGLGVDFAFMSVGFDKSVYVEQQEELCKIAENNFSLLRLQNVEIVSGNGADFLQRMEKSTCIFIDPARRDEHGGKTVRINDCEPNVKKLSALLTQKAENVIIKLSPMLDVSQAILDLPQTKAVYVVSVANECKELLLILNEKTEALHIPIHCVNIRKESHQLFSFDLNKEAEALCDYTSIPEKYIYEPNSSILKAGAYKMLSHSFQIKKFHPNSHLYTSDIFIKEFPGRIFEFKEMFSLNKKEMKNQLQGIDKANLTVRNFPTSVVDLRKRLKLKEGGEVYLFATTLENGDKMILRCTKVW